MLNINNQATKFNTDLIPSGTPGLRIGDGSRPMYLVLLNGGLAGRMVRLNVGQTLLGRAEDNTVPIFDADISRYHASLEARETGEVWIEDLGSTNGTFCNGERLPAQKPTRIDDGDQLQFGSTVIFKFFRPTPSDEKLLKVLFERAACDPLTGLYNRAYFLEQVVYQAMRGARVGHGLAILLLDIDHFKRINDTYGHGVGDEVLRMVANDLRESVRSDDLVARYGGEEFILALTAPALAQARNIAETIRVRLAARSILVAGLSIRVTASLGGDFAKAGKFREPARMIQVADQALYRAKHAGRDRICFDENLAEVPAG